MHKLVNTKAEQLLQEEIDNKLMSKHRFTLSCFCGFDLYARLTDNLYLSFYNGQYYICYAATDEDEITSFKTVTSPLKEEQARGLLALFPEE